MNLGFLTWKPNPDADPTTVDNFFTNRFRRTALYGYTDIPTNISSEEEFSNLWHCRFRQWPLPCDFHEMPESELQTLKIQSVQGWALPDEDWFVQGLSIKLNNGMADYGDFAGAEQI